jgi:hypothetical protein
LGLGGKKCGCGGGGFGGFFWWLRVMCFFFWRRFRDMVWREWGGASRLRDLDLDLSCREGALSVLRGYNVMSPVGGLR